MNLGLETGDAAPALIAALRPRAEEARLWAERTLPKGAPIFAAADGSDDVVLLLSGLVKLVYTTEAGEDWVKSFILDQGVFSGRGAADDGQGRKRKFRRCGQPCLSACPAASWNGRPPPMTISARPVRPSPHGSLHASRPARRRF